MIYIDSSVALAWIFREPRSPAPSFWESALTSSRLLEYEIWNRIHAYGLTGSHSVEAQALLARVDLIETDRPSLARALQPFPLPLRTLDALHLATAVFVAGTGNPVELASYDDRLTAGARAIGIPIAAL